MVKVLEGGIRGWVRVEIMRGERGRANVTPGKTQSSEPRARGDALSLPALSSATNAPEVKALVSRRQKP